MYKFIILLFAMMLLSGSNKISAQNKDRYVRIARLVIDSAQLKDYQKALKEHAAIAVKEEPGVIMLYAVYEKERPVNVNVFEIYANEAAYKSHIKTVHFLKYKATVQNMVKSLTLIDVTPIALESKVKIPN